MVHISKRKVKRETFDAIGKQLIASVVHARTKNEAAVLLDELLTDSERIMLAKRFATIAMLARGYSFQQTGDVLKVSESTVIGVSRKMREGAYDHLIRYARNQPRKIEGETFIDLLEKLLRAGIMPPMGRGRWANLDRWDRKSEYFT